MRPLGEFEDEDQASLFTGFLLYKDMEAEMEEEEEGGPWTVWVKDEDKLASAMAELSTIFLKNGAQVDQRFYFSFDLPEDSGGNYVDMTPEGISGG